MAAKTLFILFLLHADSITVVNEARDWSVCVLP